MDALPELLDCLAKRPQMFVHSVSFFSVQGFLAGLAQGLRYAGIEWTWDDYQTAAAMRGWDPRGSIGILRDFTNRGLTDAEMVRELVAVEAAAYTLALARINHPK